MKSGVSESELLRRAWQLIEQPEHWTTRVTARDEAGDQVRPEDGKACCWCAVGALEKICAEQGADLASCTGVIRRLGDAAEFLFGTRAIAQINDLHGHDGICRIFQHAIANAPVARAEADADRTEIEGLQAKLATCLERIDRLERCLGQSLGVTARPGMPLSPSSPH